MRNISINEYLRKLGYAPPGDSTYAHILEWLEWYQGEVEKFHKYKVFNGTTIKEENRFRLGMAKKVAEDWANLILNEKVSIKAGEYEKRLNEILEDNNFRVRGNQLIELAYALGTGALVEYKVNDKIVIDYVRADMIRPLSWDNGRITECAFGSYRTKGGKEIIYLQIHRKGRTEEGENENTYYLENKYVDVNGGEELEAPEEVLPIVDTGSEEALFQIITPNICNNIELESPMGISVFANAIDQLKGCDLVYDSYISEFVLGKKRILVPISQAKMELQKTGVAAPVFDPNDTVYFQMPADRTDDNKPIEIDMKIRAQEHELGIQRSLDLCSFKCGLGVGRYQFNSSGVKTATEVISDKSDLYQNLKKNEIPVRAAVLGMVRAIAFLDGRRKVEATVDFDDSIIEDSNATIDRNIKLEQAGLRSKMTAIMEINKCSEADAEKELRLIAEDNQITGQDIDWTGGDDNGLELDADKAEKDEDAEEEKVHTGKIGVIAR